MSRKWRFNLRAMWWGFTHPFASREQSLANARKLADEFFEGTQ